jgi:hypothetical protein
MAMDFLTSDASFEEKVIFALSEMNTKIEGLVGNGQPGRIAIIENRISELKTAHDKSAGRNAVLASLWGSLVALIIVIIDFLARRM